RQTMTPSTNDQRPDFMERPPFKHPHIRYRSKTNLLAQAAQSCKCTNTDIAKTTGQVTDFVEESIQEERSGCPSPVLPRLVLAPFRSFDARRKSPPRPSPLPKGVPKGGRQDAGGLDYTILCGVLPFKALEPRRHFAYFVISSNQSLTKSGPPGPLFFFIWRLERQRTGAYERRSGNGKQGRGSRRAGASGAISPRDRPGR